MVEAENSDKVVIQGNPRILDDSGVMLVNLDDIYVPPERGRTAFEAIIELAEDILDIGTKNGRITDGLIHPVSLVSTPNGPKKFELVAGERRYRAHLYLSLHHDVHSIRAIDQRYASARLKKEVELRENIHRRNLHFLEESKLIKQIDDLKREEFGESSKGDNSPRTGDPKKDGWSQKNTAALLGRSEEDVNKKIQVAKLAEARPDIARKLADLPMAAFVREHKRITDSEKLEKDAKDGKLVLTDSLTHGSATEELKKIPSASVDLVVIDPPFGIDTIQEQQGEARGTTKSYTGILKETDNLSPADADELIAKVLPELFRVLKPNTHAYIFFASDHYQHIKSSAEAAGFYVDPTPLIWNKSKTTAGFTGYAYQPCYEPILHLHKFDKPETRKRLTKAGKKILDFSPPSKEEKVLAGANHPFMKPIDLLRYLIEQSSMKGDVVLDCFAGSGSTLVAAIEAGRSAVGIETDRERFIAAQGRLASLRK